MLQKPPELRKIYNPKCLKDCTTDDRRHMTDDGLCNHTKSQLDGLPIRCVGQWSSDKVYRLTQYFGIFVNGMRYKWQCLNYLEIGSGPGRCVLRETGEELDGTSLSIINHDGFEFIRKAVFVDNNTDVVEALNKRIDSLGKSAIAVAEVGDYAELSHMAEILTKLPDRCLNLVFFDPTDCSVPFSLIQLIDKSLGNVDLIANVALRTDVGRNIKQAVLDPTYSQVRQKYAAFLGGDAFFKGPEIISYAEAGNDLKLRELFLNEYRKNLRELDFLHLDVVPVKHYYYLLFATRNPRGLDFWKKACHIEPDGQRSFFKFFE